MEYNYDFKLDSDSQCCPYCPYYYNRRRYGYCPRYPRNPRSPRYNPGRNPRNPGYGPGYAPGSGPGSRPCPYS